MKYIRWGRTTCPNGAQVVYKGERMRTILQIVNNYSKNSKNSKYNFSKSNPHNTDIFHGPFILRSNGV